MLALAVVVNLPFYTAEADHETLLYYWSKRLSAIIDTADQTGCAAPVFLGVGAGMLAAFMDKNPHRAQKTIELLQQGILSVGPWYSLPAFSLPNGETLVRNLLLGQAELKAWRISASATLLPPALVLPSQVPQVLKGFGVESAATVKVFPWASPSRPRQQWQGADGSTVGLVSLALDASASSASQPTWPELASIESPPPVVLVNIQSYGDLETIPAWPESQTPVMVSFPSLADLCQSSSLKAVPAILGEIAEPRDQIGMLPLLAPSYWQSFPSLCRTMWQAQQALIRWAEPVATAGWLSQQAEYPHFFLKNAWQQVLLASTPAAVGSHPNEQLVQHMLIQAKQAEGVAEAVVEETLSCVSDRALPMATADGEVLVAVGNPVGWSRDEVVTVEAPLPTAAEHWELRSADGACVPYQIHSSTATPQKLVISFAAKNLPAVGYRRYSLTPAQSKPYFLGESIAAGNTLENRYLRVTIKPSGALRIEDKRTGKTFENCNVFEDGGDAGTVSAYAPPEYDRLITTYGTHAQLAIVENGIFLGTVMVKHDLLLPAGLNHSRKKREEQGVTCTLTSYITLRQNTPHVEIRTTVVNHARDHRLRVLFSSDIPATTCRVSQPFAVEERATGMLSKGALPGPGSMPMEDFIDIGNSDYGLSVATRGLHEYEVKPTPAGTIALTLFRSIQAGPAHEGEAAQNKPYVFEYALVPRRGGWEDNVRTIAAYVAPPRAFVVCPRTGECAEYSLLSLHPHPLLLSAVKRSEDGNWVVARVYNPTGRRLEGYIKTSFSVSRAFAASLDETPLQELPLIQNRGAAFTCQPRQIVTLLLGPQ